MRGATPEDPVKFAQRLKFQSTLLMRGATIVAPQLARGFYDFNPRSSCEERLLYVIIARQLLDFNPRSSCEERLLGGILFHKKSIFQSTLLMRGATGKKTYLGRYNTISIHAPHARSDAVKGDTEIRYIEFQSTLLMRGATVSILGIDLPDFIIYFSRTYPFSPKMPTSRHLSCKLHFLCDGTSHFGDL